MIVSQEKRRTIEANLFSGALAALGDWERFPWHQNQHRQIDSDVPHSSQALALSVFGFVKTAPQAERDLSMNTLALKAGIPAGADWKIELEWTAHGNPLSEPTPTQVDVFARHAGGVLCLECKFGEGDGGPCSQPAPIQRGAHAGQRQCNGSYSTQINPLNGREARCALSGKGIRYWQKVSDVFAIRADVDHQPCPFRGGWYQWMRNLTLCHALAVQQGVRGGVLVVYADAPGLPFAAKVSAPAWQQLRAVVRADQIGFAAVSYQAFFADAITSLREAGYGAETWAQLAEWTKAKIDTVAAARRAAPRPALTRTENPPVALLRSELNPATPEP